MSIASIAAAIIYTVFLWWFSTGAILWLDRRPRSTYRWSFLGGSALAAASIIGLVTSARDTTPASALLAFTCALGLWGWHELSFLLGFVTGPRKSACPPGASGWRRFTLAASTLLYHEVALLLTGAIVVAVLWGQPNQIGVWTFLILLGSRLSAKLNLFFGVPNFTDEFFPGHLRYLTSYLRKSPTNALFPLSIAAGCALAGAEAFLAVNPGSTAFEVFGYSLLFALTALALIEHGFMVLPLPDAALWRWAAPAAPKGGNAS
jgi:putative photosynthetic complex assembly protein 2